MLGPHDVPLVEKAACVLEHCADITFELSVLDRARAHRCAHGRDPRVLRLGTFPQRAFTWLRDVASYIDTAAFSRGDVTTGVNHYLERGPAHIPIAFEWRLNPLVGYSSLVAKC